MRRTAGSIKAFGAALLGYMVAIVLAITWAPFEWRRPPAWALSWDLSARDVITNVALFVPIGFLTRLVLRVRGAGGVVLAGAGGVALSALVEVGQAFVPGRYVQLIDVGANGVGALAGAWAFGMARAWVPERAATRVASLEMPLVNVVYLLTPLLWLDGLAALHEGARAWLGLLPGLFGAGLLGEVAARRMRLDDWRGRLRLVLLVAGGYLVGVLPALPRHRVAFPLAALALGGVAWLVAWQARAHAHSERRFELRALKRWAPVFALYLVALARWPGVAPFGAFGALDDFGRLPFRERLASTFAFVEIVAAFTLLGYLVAQARGRLGEPAWRVLGLALALATFAAFAMAALRGAAGFAALRGVELGLALAGAVYGAGAYRVQLAAFRQLAVGPRPGSSAPGPS